MVCRNRVRSAWPSAARAYNLLNSVLETSELRFPRMSPHGKLSLLVRLQDDRWACCSACQMHGGNFHSLDSSSLQQICRLWSGIVDLCPCITITPRDRTHIVDNKQCLNLVEKGLLRNGNRCLLHKCNAYSTVQVDVTFSLAKSDHLIACARYELAYNILLPLRIS